VCECVCDIVQTVGAKSCKVFDRRLHLHSKVVT